MLSLFAGQAQGYMMAHYGLEDGISEGAIRVLLRDAEGFVWFGTQDGLNRFDGYHFKIYKHDPDDTRSLCGNYINTLWEDGDRIWVGTADNGLCYYDKNTDAFTPMGNPAANCRKVVSDSAGNIYALYASGLLVRYRNGDWSADTLRASGPKTVFAGRDPDGKILVADARGALFRLANGNREPVFRLPVPAVVSAVLQEPGRLWVGTDRGLFLWQKSRAKWQRVFLTRPRGSGTPLQINDLVRQASRLYVATDAGLFIAGDWDDVEHRFRSVTHLQGDINDRLSITSNRVYDLLLDDRILWIGTNKLDLYAIENPVIRTINSKSKIKLKNDFVFSVYPAGQYLFVGTRKGLHCIDRNGRTHVITRENTGGKLAFDVIRGIRPDRKHHLWIATTKGVSVMDLRNFDPAHPVIRSIYRHEGDSLALGANNTRSVYLDRDGHIWVATYGGGVSLFTGDIDNGVYTFRTFRADTSPTGLSSDVTYHISQDGKGRYWIATNSGLDCLDLPHERVIRYGKAFGNFPASSVLSTYQDTARGLVWAGSHNGLIRMDTSGRHIKVYGRNRGLTNSTVYHIIPNRQGYLWLSTNDGLFRFDPKTEHFLHFPRETGLQSSEFNLGAAFSTGDTLYFGGVNGLNYFLASEIKRLYYEGNLIFTSLQIKRSDITPLNHPGVLPARIDRVRKITLKYDQFPAYLHFSDLHFSGQKNTDFVYKLYPNDRKWNRLGGRTEIPLLSLAPGNYTLLVQGISMGKTWNKPPLRLEIKVIPPWYRSWWAYTLYALTALWLLGMFYRFRMEKKLNERELFRLQEVARKNVIIRKTLAEKEMLFREIHHRVKNNLQVISSILSLQERHLKNPKAVAAIRDSQRRIEAISLIHQKLYTDQSITGIPIKDYIDDLVVSILHSMKVNPDRISYRSDIQNLRLKTDTAISLGLIINELVLNAIKHNPGHPMLRIGIKLFKDGEHLILRVTDNGKGTSPDTDPEQPASYGTKLIRSLAKKLKADLHYRSRDGLMVELRIRKFDEDPQNEPKDA